MQKIICKDALVRSIAVYMNYTKELFDPVLNQGNTSKKADAIESLIIQLTKEYVEVMAAIGNDNETQVRIDLADLITKQS